MPYFTGIHDFLYWVFLGWYLLLHSRWCRSEPEWFRLGGPLEAIWSRQVLRAQLTSKLGQTAQNLVWCSTKHLQGWRAHKRSRLPATVLNHFSCSFISSRVSQAAISDFDISSFCFAPLRRVWLCPPCNIYPQGSWKQQWDALCLLLSVLNKRNSLSPAIRDTVQSQPPWWISAGPPPFVSIPLVLGYPKWDTLLQVWLHKCHIERNNHFPQPAGYVYASNIACLF